MLYQSALMAITVRVRSDSRAFTVDAAASQSGAVTITGVTAGGNLTISMGAGTGALT